MVKVRYFDAFPKEENSRVLPKVQPMTVVFFLLSLLLLWVETTSFMGAHQDYQFSVHKGISETFQVNMDITVAAPCSKLEVGVSDISGDLLMVGKLMDIRPLRAEDEMAMYAIGSGWATQFGYHMFEPEEEWCRLSGIFDTNRVKGQIFIRGVPWGNRFHGTSASNFSHGINELSFGPYYPSLQNPLDETAVSTEKANEVFNYDLSLVPTTVKGFGVEMFTHQYTVTQLSSAGRKQLPGIYLTFDFDPIALTLIDGRMGFFPWLFRLANIIGGIAFAISWYRRRKQEKDYNEDSEELDEKV